MEKQARLESLRVADELRKGIAYPDILSFGELFTTEDPKPIKWEESEIGTYCAVSGVGGHRSLKVQPLLHVVQYIKANMLEIGDRLYFEIVIRDNGTALVTVSHNKILGNRWLAIIDPATIPQANNQDR